MAAVYAASQIVNYVETKNKGPGTPKIPAISSYDSLQKSLMSQERKPTPYEFDTFIPWAMKQWEASKNAVIIRMSKEPYISKSCKKSSMGSTKSMKLSKSNRDTADETDIARESPPLLAIDPELDDWKNNIPIITMYDTQNRLVEIAIINSPSKIHKKIIHSFRVCVPYHPLLSKLTVRKGGIDHLIVYEISKLLVVSNISDLCLDDCFVPEGNYAVLLDRTSRLTNLSLSRCHINDYICSELVARLDNDRIGGNHGLVVLNLASNNITDAGAQSLGRALRRNRTLLHLNLSDNHITDEGTAHLFKHLMKFPLTYDEIVRTKGKKIEYVRKKLLFLEMHSQEIGVQTSKTDLYKSTIKFSKVSRSPKKAKKNQFVQHPPQSAQDTAGQGPVNYDQEFNEVYNDDNIVKHNGYAYCIGNFKLCSLNLAFNNLSFESILTIQNVLRYQNTTNKPSSLTGLIRIVLQGNNIPQQCKFMDEIEILLQQAMPKPPSTLRVPAAPPIGKQIRKRSQRSSINIAFT